MLSLTRSEGVRSVRCNGILKILILIFTFSVLSHCRSRNQANDLKDQPAHDHFQLITAEGWDKLAVDSSRVFEWGCSCELSESHWDLYRFVDLKSVSYKIRILTESNLEACIGGKFQKSHCQYKF